MARRDEIFKEKVMQYYDSHGRNHLPWRKGVTPYRVLVSEVMLQQTQVERVIPYFKRWVKHYPSFKKLSEAPKHEVLKLWSGLGYNRRALALHKTAHILSHKRTPKNQKELQKLPGIGPYTAGAILNFAFNQWTPFIDTNIRRVFLFHFFNGKENVRDEEVLTTMERVGYDRTPREWGYALMDYGAFLKTQLQENPNRKSSHYKKQKPFLYSTRYWRSRILKILLERGKIEREKLISLIAKEAKSPTQREVEKILTKMEEEGFLLKNDGDILLNT